jgi:DNA-binding response OmpR family regulator
MAQEAATGTGTVLLVEDHDAVRVLAKRVLTGLGYQVIEAADGDLAMAVAADRGCTVDLLLSDVVLPGKMNGVQLAEAVSVLRPGLKVLFMSGYPRDTVARTGRLDLGVNYLPKPFTPDGLARRVREVLEG